MDGTIANFDMIHFAAREKIGSLREFPTLPSISEHSAGITVSATRNDAAIDTSTASESGVNIFPSMPLNPNVGINTIIMRAVA